MNIVEKIFNTHIVKGKLYSGETISLKIDQAFTQDATGTLVYLQFEALKLNKIKIPLAVSYVDHNILQIDSKNADDHIYLQTSAAKYGAYFSKPGNGICHQIHLERFAKPGCIILGSDSHTPTAGGIGALGIGVGGLDLAVSLAGVPFSIKMPEVVLVRLNGKLNRPYVTAFDMGLELLRRFKVTGGIGKIFEYGGEGIKNLSVTERSTITNMGSELGATSSIFPSDERTKRFLIAQKREKDWIEILPDKNAKYNEIIEIDLDKIEPLVAKPHSPDNVVRLKDVKGEKVNQVCIGSCTNSSYQVMQEVASILKGRTINKNVSMSVSCGSRQVFDMMSRNGELEILILAGVRILECACGPCIGIGGAPANNSVSVRTFNRNFKGRAGTSSASIYLCSHISAIIAAIKGEFIEFQDASIKIKSFKEVKEFLIDDTGIIPPSKNLDKVNVIKGPNIKDIPFKKPLENNLTCKVTSKLKDNISTDDILPASSNILSLRSNISEISKYIFFNIDKNFYDKTLKARKSVIVAGSNYGQGSSREHAAIVPMYLGVKAIISKSFARIHRDNLINYGILPLNFINSDDYEKIEQGDVLKFNNLIDSLNNKNYLIITNKSKKEKIKVKLDLSKEEKEIIKSGGLLHYVKTKYKI